MLQNYYKKNNKGQAVFSIILTFIVVFLLLIFLMPFFFVSSDIASNGQTGIYGFLTGYWGYIILLMFIIIILWRAYAG